MIYLNRHYGGENINGYKEAPEAKCGRSQREIEKENSFSISEDEKVRKIGALLREPTPNYVEYVNETNLSV